MTERQNIRRMQVLESTEVTGPFDADREITKADWKRIRQQEEIFLKSADDVTHSAITGFNLWLSVIAPGEPYLQKDRWEERLKKSLAMWPVAFERYLQDLALARQLGLQDIKLEGVQREQIENDFSQLIEKTDAMTLATNLATYAKIASPNAPLRYGEREMQRFAARAQDLREMGPWHNAAVQMAFVKLLGAPLKPLSAEEWRALRKTLDEERSGTMGFLSLAGAMKILAAEDAKVTEKGITLTMPPKDDAKETMPNQPHTLEV